MLAKIIIIATLAGLVELSYRRFECLNLRRTVLGPCWQRRNLRQVPRRIARLSEEPAGVIEGKGPHQCEAFHPRILFASKYEEQLLMKAVGLTIT